MSDSSVFGDSEEDGNSNSGDSGYVGGDFAAPAAVTGSTRPATTFVFSPSLRAPVKLILYMHFEILNRLLFFCRTLPMDLMLRNVVQFWKKRCEIKR